MIFYMTLLKQSKVIYFTFYFSYNSSKFYYLLISILKIMYYVMNMCFFKFVLNKKQIHIKCVYHGICYITLLKQRKIMYSAFYFGNNKLKFYYLLISNVLIIYYVINMCFMKFILNKWQTDCATNASLLSSRLQYLLVTIYSVTMV